VRQRIWEKPDLLVPFPSVKYTGNDVSVSWVVIEPFHLIGQPSQT
jgi:hypothetical protein